MLHGLMVVNGFLQAAKYRELSAMLVSAAQELDQRLTAMNNDAAMTLAETDPDALRAYDYVLFWDKDIALARLLTQLGLPLFNSWQSVLACDDKSLTYLTLREQGIPMPRTFILPKTFSAVGYPHLDWLGDMASHLAFPMILKECFGSFGEQVYLMRDMDELTAKVRSLAGTPMLLQAFISESSGRDVRVNVVGGRVCCAMRRVSENGDFRSNITRGGSMYAYEPTPEEAALALRAVQGLGLCFAGVDVLQGKDGPILCEVNSNPHFKSTLTCTGVNLALEILRQIALELRG